MASTKEYAEYILGQLEPAGEISTRKMMGEYILYYRGKIFGGIYDNRFLVKITPSSERMMPNAAHELPYDGAKPMLSVDDVDDREFLKSLVEQMYDELPEPKPKKKSEKK